MSRTLKLKLTNFLLSRSSQNPKGESLYSGHPIDNCFSIILDIENSRIDYYKLMMENIGNSLKYYEGSIESANSGINILVKIMNRFTELSVDNSIGLEPLIDYTHGILYDINKYRKMFSLYLYTMNCYFNTVTTEEYELFQGITSQWGILLQLFIKIKLLKNINLLEKVLAIFSLVYKQENSFYTSLLTCIPGKM